MADIKDTLASKLARISVDHPWLILLIAFVITVISLVLSSGLEMRMNWSDILPEDNPVVKSYRDVQDRFGDGSGIVIALEGDYERICAMADTILPYLEELDGLYNVQGRVPLDYIKDHGFALLKPDDFERMLKVFSDPSLTGTLRGINDDYEREYTDSESNLRRDEVDIARSLLGMHRALEVLTENITPPRSAGGESKGGAGDEKNIPPIETAVDAITLGEPWFISLDRHMLLIICETLHSQLEIKGMLETTLETEKVMDRFRPLFPDVSANLTGIARIGQDEMESVGIYTIFLSIGALLLIYLLLARSFRGWVLPLMALLPLMIGIFWTTGLLYLLFGSLNLFTAMIMIVLLGLGIDFAIHTISRFNEETTKGKSTEEALSTMLSSTGVAVITGGLTSAAAFLTLLIGKSSGVFEFGAAAGFGVLLTLAAILFILPPILAIRVRVLRKRRQEKLTASNETFDTTISTASEAFPIIGKIARTGWRHPWIFISITLLVCIFSLWAKRHIEFEYDWLELEPKGLKSIQLQREIPERFGMSDHASWMVVGSVEESRVLKEQFKKKPLVGDVMAISDYIPPADRLESYRLRLLEFRKSLALPPSPGLKTSNGLVAPPPSPPPQSGGGASDSSPPRFAGGESKGGVRGSSTFKTSKLLTEITRLWDNLDLMSNLAYTAGLDRIVKVIDGITGTQSETGEVNKNAVLPTLSRILKEGIEEENANRVTEDWERKMRENVYAMANPDPVDLDDLPEVVKRSHLPREGEGYLIYVVPRRSLWCREDMESFAEQTLSVSENVSGTEQLMIIMFDAILADGKKAAFFALTVIIILVLIHFRGPIGLLSLVPLAAGALTMIGLMYLIDEKYNYLNLIAVPVILGIGIDDGIHALHRFLHEQGTGSERIERSFSFVGRAILLTSLTTMIGFGSIAFYTMQGMASFGRALFMGVGTCFLATIFVLPAVLRLFTKR